MAEVSIPNAVVMEMRKRIALQLMAQKQILAKIAQQRMAQQALAQQRMAAQQQPSIAPEQAMMLQQAQQDADDQRANEAFQGVQLQKAVM